ncbi:DUF3850 domain-containing protein [Mycolicibacterium komossense]|uniref:DUF3850 domain-containing protein n=1 Tax=Mycolicibacterium komossense TaxID=1779 RepID=A0ABT3CA33_9MYCO|nr:DUF3850 domain-containing protein [Mycolicibacterium komossense]MCV7226096.1 DUF3850 domain-containing protein [Mycolicibacterium komossense]
MTTHDVKIEPRWFDRIQGNEKFAEVRFDDRDYQTGDTVRFWRNDTEPEYRYSVERRITHVLRAADGLAGGYVVLSLADPRVDDYRSRWERGIAENERLARSNAGLRGVNTRLRNGA